MTINKPIKVTVAVLALLAIVITAFAVGRSPAPPANVTLTWTATPGLGLGTYNVYQGPSSGNYTNVVNAGTNQSIIFSNLVRGGTYYFAATAVSTNGLESLYSNEVSYSPSVPPPVPLNLQVTAGN